MDVNWCVGFRLWIGVMGSACYDAADKGGQGVNARTRSGVGDGRLLASVSNRTGWASGWVAHARGGGGSADGPSVFAAGVTVHLQKIFDGAKTVSFGLPVADGVVADVASLGFAVGGKGDRGE